MAMAQKKTAKIGLGRGFDSLLPQNFDSSLLLDDSEKIKKVPLAKLQPNAEQPRTHFDQETLGQLAQSIKQYGILQPLVASPLPDGSFQIIAGERRWRAAQLAGLDTVPVLVRSSKQLEQLEIALVENVQRVDLTPLEQAVSIERLHQQFSMSYEAIGERLGKASSTMSNLARLLQLPEVARKALADQRITEGHGRAILSLKAHPEKQAEMLRLIIQNGWSVRQAERYVTSHKAGVDDKKAVKARVETETRETKALSKQIKAQVQIRRTAKGGKVELGFRSEAELERLLRLLAQLSDI